MRDSSLRECIAIGGTNTVERYQNALIRYGKQSFGIFWEVFRDLEIKEDLTIPQRMKTCS